MILSARALERRYPLPRTRVLGPRRHREALRGVDLDVGEGDGSTGIVGESGSGKSTLVRLLLALDRPDAGTLIHRGTPVVRAGRDFRRDVQVVLQDPFASLDPRMRVARIVAEPLECLDVPGDHRARVRELLTAVGLGPEAADRYPHQFSGGQRQRIAIARALAPGPRVLVGDEPLSALDVAVRVQVMDLLRGLAADLGLSLVLVSHDIGAVARLCRRIVVLHEGRIVERGDTAEVLAAPRDPYTRRLLAAVPTLPELR
ncbi:Oligopeptide transport ATP-binding protein OppF [Pseudonocardia sp. Ae406_Ps2]|uniref:ABC transporter ATP-binding protein n=1 Tax=unclassified Pseudonocardia TaxID=2619320 RepID=UPI00094B5133|nr:Oligopeptide transport ATP-binding protein OppF [Pseudonocardia sp. Ae406_Ps2]OLM22866.1 Oligopeptide transport ATP-binding protein OppF [Pseudonocardia sp. Ae706_Ps2]OLM31264.1 Oligopeptide transport ATP-binding protein OppF [Pseudonocardia sp. Ae717_Ps2]